MGDESENKSVWFESIYSLLGPPRILRWEIGVSIHRIRHSVRACAFGRVWTAVRLKSGNPSIQEVSRACVKRLRGTAGSYRRAEGVVRTWQRSAAIQYND